MSRRLTPLKDIVAAPNKVQPYDWKKFFQTCVYDLAPHVPENGIPRGGHSLAYSNTPPRWWLKEAGWPHFFSSAFSSSIGISVQEGGTLSNVWWGGPAYKAGITPDMKIIAVNGTAFKPDVLRSAIKDAKKSTASLKLLMKRGKKFETVSLDYHKGLRYPKLERVEGTPDPLDAILAPVK